MSRIRNDSTDSRLLGLALAGGGNVGPPGVGKHFAISDDSNADLVGTALKSNHHRHGN